jgi:hypothetical protein
LILLDLSPVIYSTFLATHKEGTEIDEGYIRHLILNSIRSYLVKFRSEYGDLVICSDPKHYWRKDVFPNYKVKRKENRDDSGLDWDKLFSIVDKVKTELKTVFPYKFIEVDSAEADDVIAILTKKFANSSEKILIISRDKDFKQLQKYDNVSQYNVIEKQWMKCEDPLLFIKEHILLGDKGDGIPNFLSDDDVLIIKGKRQTPIHKKKLAIWVTQEPKYFCNSRMMRNYDRNRMLIDFDYIPQTITDLVLKEFENAPQTRSGLYNYFVKNKLVNLMSSIGDF